ncbi:MAG: dienelactone hydrolase family protein [Methylocella sp.]
MLFEQWRDRFGWIIGALLIMTVVAVMIVQYQYRAARPPRIFSLVGLAVGISIGGLLFLPAVPRIVTALWQLVIAQAPMDSSGPFPVATIDVTLPSAAGDPAILVQIWYPTGGNPSAVTSLSESTPPPCSKALDHRHLAGSEQQFPIILYAPGSGGVKDDSASTTAELASHGYIILAIDDIERDPHPPVAAGEVLPPLIFDYSSDAAFSALLQTGARKARLQAEWAMTALDRFEACANADWHARVHFDRVGFFGFSFGGATAAEAGTFDPRVVAVANLDGSLMGHAAFGALEKPYMAILTRDDLFPSPRQLWSSHPYTRNLATLIERDLREEVRLVNRPGSFGIRIRNAYHENLSDQFFSRRFFKTWLITNPYRVKSIRDAYLLAFFDTRLRGIPSPLLTQYPPPFHEVEILNADPYWLREAAKSIQATSSPN